MIDDRKTQNNDNLISDTTFWDLYPVDLSSVEDVSVQSLPVSVRVTNLLMHNGVKTVADLFRMKVDDFIKLRGAGKKCYDETCQYLSDLSNRAVEIDPSLGAPKVAAHIPQIVADNIESIINQNFAFCEELPIGSEDAIAVDKYKEAVEILGAELARVCYQTPNKILPLMDALKPFIKAQQEREYRKNKISESLALIPTQRFNNSVRGYINAFTTDEEQRKTLGKIYGLELYPNARIKNYIFEPVAESVTDFALLLNFLRWCFLICPEFSGLSLRMQRLEKTLLLRAL